MGDLVLACVGEFGGVLVSTFRLTSRQVRPAPSRLGVPTATVVLWAFKRPQPQAEVPPVPFGGNALPPPTVVHLVH